MADDVLTTHTDDTPVGIIRPVEARRPARDRSRRRRRPLLRRTLLGTLFFVLVLLGYYVVSLLQVWSTGKSDQARPVDAIVVLGAAQYDGEPSPQLAARLDHVAELWPRELAPVVVTTGGGRPGDRFTEAQASASYLAERECPSRRSCSRTPAPRRSSRWRTWPPSSNSGASTGS